MKFVGADEEPFAQAAVDHHADDVERIATVAAAFAAGIAFAAIHVRFDAAAVARLDVDHTVTHCEHFHAQFHFLSSG